MFSIYIHIPFCQKKCFYCDFPSIAAGKNLYSRYTAALIKEIYLSNKKLGRIAADTVYFGGGTPSLLPAGLIGQMLTAVKTAFNISSNAEITLEANPGTVSFDKLSEFKALGVNRLSFGIQATQNSLLKKLGRIHTFENAREAVSDAKQAGFGNISLDLMYGLPSQTLIMVRESLDWFLQQNIQHISIYGLQIEAGTPFADMLERGSISLPHEELAEKMYDYITGTLPEYGFSRYEIANFAQKGFESRHNTGYWQDKPYLGLGCAAHSYYNKRRIYNTHDIYEYMNACSQNIIPFSEEEKIDRRTWMEEFCFLALRTAKGIDKNKFRENFSCDPYDIYGSRINQLIAQKLLTDRSGCLCLTPLGMKLGNIVFEKFLL